MNLRVAAPEFRVGGREDHAHFRDHVGIQEGGGLETCVDSIASAGAVVHAVPLYIDIGRVHSGNECIKARLRTVLADRPVYLSPVAHHNTRHQSDKILSVLCDQRQIVDSFCRKNHADR